MADSAISLPGLRTRQRAKIDLRTMLLIAGPVVLIAAAAWIYFTGGRYITTDNAYVSGDLVMLSTDVSGIVKEIDVTENQRVEPGQVLFKLDDAPFKFSVDNAKAQLSLAKSQVEGMKASLKEKHQAVQLAEINVNFATKEWARRSDLFKQHVVAQISMDQAQQALDLAQQQLAQAQREVATTIANLGGDAEIDTTQHPVVLAAQAKLDQALRDVGQTEVKAPVGGIVTNVPSLQTGRYLPASTPAFALVASDSLWVQANPKETELTYVRPGQKVKVTVDTYPGVEWDGTVASLSPASASQFALLPAQNSSGNWVKVVQRIPIRVAIKQDADKPILRAGMSAVIDIDTGHRRTLGGLLQSVGL